MRDLIRLFESHGVEYLVVGGFAVNHYGYVRTTQDIDFLLRPSAGNAGRVMAALRDFGFGDAGIPPELFATPGSAIHLGVEPNRIDLLTRLEGLDAAAAFATPERALIDDVAVAMISFDHLIQAKRSSKRVRDQADVEELLRMRSEVVQREPASSATRAFDVLAELPEEAWPDERRDDPPQDREPS